MSWEQNSIKTSAKRQFLGWLGAAHYHTQDSETVILSALQQARDSFFCCEGHMEVRVGRVAAILAKYGGFSTAVATMAREDDRTELPNVTPAMRAFIELVGWVVYGEPDIPE